MYSYISTDTVPLPEWVVFNTSLSDTLGLGSDPESEDLAILSGNKPPPQARVFAQSYAGHQFGHFTNLGDGRAAVLGEILDPRGNPWDLQDEVAPADVMMAANPRIHPRNRPVQAALEPSKTAESSSFKTYCGT